MRQLIYKELKLVLHPTNILFLCLGSLFMIPGYPYSVVFFYACLGLFFTCVAGRENKDLYYTMLLPVSKRAVVGARFCLVILIELLQFAASVPFVLLRNAMYSAYNPAGMNVTPAFFGFIFLLLGLFNFLFFPKFYKNPNQIGLPFFASCMVFAAGILLVEGGKYLFPPVDIYLNTPGNQYLFWQIAVLAAGAALWAALTAVAFRRSAKAFEKVDL